MYLVDKVYNFHFSVIPFRLALGKDRKALFVCLFVCSFGSRRCNSPNRTIVQALNDSMHGRMIQRNDSFCSFAELRMRTAVSIVRFVQLPLLTVL